MLFNSYGFIFLFLPAVLLGAFACGRIGRLAPVVFLGLASLAFYAIGNWQFVPLLVASIAFNFVIGHLLIERKLRPAARCAALITGVGGDLVILGIFKYAGFFATNLNAVFATHVTINILLPVEWLLGKQRLVHPIDQMHAGICQTFALFGDIEIPSRARVRQAGNEFAQVMHAA